MSFFNNLGQKISDVSQTTIKKTKDLADTAKLNLNISEEERKIDTAYEQIGKWYVEKHREDAEEDVKTWLDAIAVSEARIKECRESIHQMKGVAICPSCGASVDSIAPRPTGSTQSRSSAASQVYNRQLLVQNLPTHSAHI